jgi:uncharacterized cupin superfamily protein
MRRLNILTADLVAGEGGPEGFRGGVARLEPAIGMRQLAGALYELPPGQSVCPYHWEAGDEELLLVLRGAVSVRTPEGEETLVEGELVCFTAGPSGAHRVTNTTDQVVRIVMLSTSIEPAIAVYPDSNKLGAYDKASGTRMLFRIGDAVDYYDGEAT